MKGIIFVEFVDMLDVTVSATVVEELLEEADLPSGGAYTAVGTYSFEEMVTLVTLLSEKTGIPATELQKTFGQHLFKGFVTKYPSLFKDGDDTYSLLARVNDTIHVEVLKLYPDAELPHFTHTWREDGQMELVYRSTRPFADVAEGLIVGCMNHFGDDLELTRTDISPAPNTHSIFVLARKST